MNCKIKRTTPFPENRIRKDKNHACYVITIKNLIIKINVWDNYKHADFNIMCHPSNAVNGPALQYFKDRRQYDDKADTRVQQSFDFLNDILTRDEKYVTKTDLIHIKSALRQVFKKIDQRVKRYAS